MPRARLALAVPLAVALVVAAGGCFSGDLVRVERPALRLTVDEYTIRPQDVSVRPGRLKLIVTNEGSLFHNVRVETIPDSPEERGEILGGTETAEPGEEVEAKVTLEAGEYRMICTLGNHDDLGQYGRLVVEGEPLQ